MWVSRRRIDGTTLDRIITLIIYNELTSSNICDLYNIPEYRAVSDIPVISVGLISASTNYSGSYLRGIIALLQQCVYNHAFGNMYYSIFIIFTCKFIVVLRDRYEAFFKEFTL